MYYATQWGPWAYSDATGYMMAASNLVHGHGIATELPAGGYSPLVSHPPLYVISLAALISAGLDPIGAARVLDVALFAAFLIACGLLALRISRSLWFALATAGLFLTHPQLVLFFVSAMSDSLFLLLGTLGLLLLTVHLTKDSRAALFGSAALAGLAFLTRYPGVAYVATGGFLLMARRTRLWTRLTETAAYVAMGTAPTGYFLLRATSLAGAEAPRQLLIASSLHLRVAEFGSKLFGAIWTWKPVPPAALMPDWVLRFASAGLARTLLLLLGGAGGTAILWLAFTAVKSDAKFKSRTPERLLVWVFGSFSAIYLLFFLSAFTLTYPVPDINSRTILPLLPALVLIGLAVARVTVTHWRAVRVTTPITLLLLAGALTGYAIITADTVLGMHRTGLGYTSRAWRESELIARIGALPRDTPIVSNEPSPITLLTGRVPYLLPVDVLESPDATFGTGDTAAETAFRQHAGVLVLFESIDQELGELHGDQAGARGELLTRGLDLVLQAPDGAIYAAPESRR